MNKLLNISRFWGPLGTVLFTLIYHYGVIQGWYEVSLSLIFLFVIAGAFASGLRGGLIAAAWGSAYALYVMLPSSRVYQTIIGMTLAALLVGYSTRWLRRSILAEVAAREAEIVAREAEMEARELASINQAKANIVDQLTNGNVGIFKRYLKTLDDLHNSWDVISGEEKIKMVQSLRGNMSDLITLAKGFDYLAKQRGFVIEHYSKDE